MKKRIDKLERVKPMALMGMMGDVAPQWVAKELNKIIDHLNSQDQEEEVEESVWDMLEREEDGYIKEIRNYWQKNGHKHIEIEIVPNEPDEPDEPDEPEKVYVDPIVPNFTEELSWPVEYKTRKQVKEMFKDTPEEWEKELRKRWYLWTYNKELDQYITCENEVIDFIQAELDKVREETRQEERGMFFVWLSKLTTK